MAVEAKNTLFVIDEKSVRIEPGPSSNEMLILADSRYGDERFSYFDDASEIIMDYAGREGNSVDDYRETLNTLGQVADAKRGVIKKFRGLAERALEWYEDQDPSLRGQLELGVGIRTNLPFFLYDHGEIGVWKRMIHPAAVSNSGPILGV